MHPSVLFAFCVSSLQDLKELKFSAFFSPVTMRIVLKKWNPNHPAAVKQKYFYGETTIWHHKLSGRSSSPVLLSARGRKGCVEVG